MADDRTRIGLIGINERARRLLLPGLAAAPRARLAAVCSRDPHKAAQVAAELGPAVRPFASADELARSGAVDAVFVNTPVEAHYDACMAAISAGRAVICEKPLAPTTREATALAEAAAARGVRTAVNFTYRSVPGYRLTERWLGAHGIGRPLHGEFALWQGHNFLPGFPRASALLDSGVHLLDAMVGLAGAAGMGRVVALSAAPMQTGRGAQGAASAALGADGGGVLPAGQVGQVDFGWSFVARTSAGAVLSGLFTRSALGWRNGLGWRLYGEEGAISVELDGEWTQARCVRRGDGQPQGCWRPLPVPADIEADDRRFPEYHMDRLVGAVRGEEAFPDFAHAAAIQRLADALATAAASGRWTAVQG